MTLLPTSCADVYGMWRCRAGGMSERRPLNMSARSAKRLRTQIPAFLGMCLICYVWKTFGRVDSNTATPDAASPSSSDVAIGRRLLVLNETEEAHNDCLGKCISAFEQARLEKLAGDFKIINGANMLRYTDKCEPDANFRTSKTTKAVVKKEKRGWMLWYIFSIVYMFAALAIVCDEFFVPALECFVDEFSISMDVAGATFMAAGGSMPELFTSFIATFQGTEVGFVAIVGSAVFNVLFVIAVCAIASPKVLPLTWWPLARDCSFYVISLLTVAVVFSWRTPNIIEWWEAVILLAEYVLYCSFMKFNGRVNMWVDNKLARWKVAPDTTPEVVNGDCAHMDSAEESWAPRSSQASCGPAFTKPNTFRLGIVQLLTRNSYVYDTAGIAAVTQVKGELVETFKSLDKNNDMKLDVEEVKPLLKSLGCKCDNAAIKTALRRINRDNGDDQISFENFEKWYISSEARIEAEIHRVFDSFDRDHNGFIDCHEIKYCLQSLGHRPTDEEVQTLMAELTSSDKSCLDRGESSSTKVIENSPTSTEPEETPIEAFTTDGSLRITEKQFEDWYRKSLFFRTHQEHHQAELEAAEGGYLTLDMPQRPSCRALFWYIFTYPICAVLYITLPDVRHPNLQRNFQGTLYKMAIVEFLLSLVWIGIFSLWLYECIVVVSQTLDIPVAVSAVTFLAGGTSVPDLFSSYVVARSNQADMAVSSSIGSNIFDITVGLPLPWLCYNIYYWDNFDLGKSGSKGLAFSLLLLIGMLASVVITIHCMGWTMNKPLGYVMMVLYVLYVVQYLLQNLPDNCDNSKDGLFQINF